MRSAYTNTGRATVSLLALTLASACGASGDGPEAVGPGTGSGSGTGTGSGSVGPDGNPPPVLDDGEFVEIEQEFWIPPKFVGSGCTGAPGLWGQAVQEALWFFHVNKSGPGITHTYVQWRGDSHLEDGHIQLVSGDPNGVNMPQAYIDEWRDVLDPDGDGEVDMAGGMYDAGDFLKAGITENYAAHTLAWTAWEFEDAFRQTGLLGEVLGILKWHADYFMKNTYISNRDTESDPWQWQVVAYGHDVGDASDHTYGWMPPELRRTTFAGGLVSPRMGYFATLDEPHANVSAGAAASLALIGWHFRGVDPEYATRCLNHAIALYEFAKREPSSNWSTAGLYTSEDPYDDLAWAAIWLHEVLPEPGQPGATELTTLYASHKQSYLDDLITDDTGWIENFRNGAGPDIGIMESGSVAWTEGWTYCWNSLRSGIFVKMAEILQRYGNRYGQLGPAFQSIAREDSLAWVTTPKTPGGFSRKVSDTWGIARYNSAAQLVALTYAKAFPNDVVPASDAYTAAGISGQSSSTLLVDWARGQSEYLLGDNPNGESYMMGFTGLGTFSSEYAHHAGAHASIYGECNNPDQAKHIAYGALVSGPDSIDDHSTDRCNYGANEVTIDYNASFLGALAANYHFQGAGQCPDPAFPPLEPPFDEYYTEARTNGDSGCRTQVELTLVNETAHPPRFDDKLTTRYYIDVSELQAQGIDPSTITASLIHENWLPEEPTGMSALMPCTLSTSTYFFEFAYPYDFWGRQVRLRGPRTILLDIGVANGPGCVWNADNDWGYQNLTDTAAKSPNVPAYSAGQIVWGAEPLCNEPPKKVIPPQLIR